MSSPFADLPAVVLALVPEAAEGWPDESRATCDACPLAAETAPHPWSFAPDARCCTYHPTMPNYLVGRALERGGRGRELIEARLAEPAGVTPLGIAAPPAHLAHYRAVAGAGFGRDLSLRCPFWVGGEHACGMWHDRPTTCRAWFCKHDGGLGGAVDWAQVAAAVTEAEELVAGHLVGLGRPPADGATPSAWRDWFAWCAARCAELGPDDAAALVSPRLGARREQLVAIRRRPARRLGPVLVPSVSELQREPDRVLITGYSTFDAVVAPPAVFAFLARLDGATRWIDALAAARAQTGEARLDERLVDELHRVGALRAPDGSDDLPFSVEPMPASLWIHAERRGRDRS